MFPSVSSKYESLYSKCLFRTIGYEELKNELEKHKITIYSDSYYVMCLKLRLSLLKESDCCSDDVTSIEAELEAINRSTRGYYCSFIGCKFTTPNYNKLLTHLKTNHGGRNQNIVCQLGGCKRELSNLTMLNLHIKTCHRPRGNKFFIKQNQIAEQLTSLNCLSASCGHQKVASIKDLKKTHC